MTGLHAVVRTLLLDVSIGAGAGEVVALVGPNGAGKTTLLRALAGLVPVVGRVVLDGRDITAAPPARRQVGYVPQDLALFPHLTALANVAFGPRATGRRRADAHAREWLERLGVADLGARRPAALSGGQAQRVALARALATGPRLLLLDEPLAALDGAARTDVRRALRDHLASYDGVTLIVSHDPVDAATLAARVVVLEEGRVVQDAPPAEVTRAPRSAWVARMLGWNACPGRLEATRVVLDTGGALLAAELPRGAGPAVATFPPWAVALYPDRPDGSPRNTWRGTVRDVLPSAGRLRVRVLGEPGAPADVVAEVTPGAAAALGLVEGGTVWATVKATEVVVTAL